MKSGTGNMEQSQHDGTASGVDRLLGGTGTLLPATSPTGYRDHAGNSSSTTVHQGSLGLATWTARLSLRLAAMILVGTMVFWLASLPHGGAVELLAWNLGTTPLLVFQGLKGIAVAALLLPVIPLVYWTVRVEAVLHRSDRVPATSLPAGPFTWIRAPWFALVATGEQDRQEALRRIVVGWVSTLSAGGWTAWLYLDYAVEMRGWIDGRLARIAPADDFSDGYVAALIAATCLALLAARVTSHIVRDVYEALQGDRALFRYAVEAMD